MVRPGQTSPTTISLLHSELPQNCISKLLAVFNDMRISQPHSDSPQKYFFKPSAVISRENHSIFYIWEDVLRPRSTFTEAFTVQIAFIMSSHQDPRSRTQKGLAIVCKVKRKRDPSSKDPIMKDILQFFFQGKRQLIQRKWDCFRKVKRKMHMGHLIHRFTQAIPYLADRY